MRFSFGGQPLGKQNTVRLKPMDWLLIIGFCFAPMTGLRVWKAGPAEVICLIWSLWTFANSKLLVSDILKPWWLSGKESACRCKRLRFNPQSRKIPHATKNPPANARDSGSIPSLGRSHMPRSN